MRQGTEADRDLTMELEDEMQASGRGHVVPREGRIGAHEQRRGGPARGAREAATHEVEEQLYQDQKALEAQEAAEANAARQRVANWLRAHQGALVVAGCGLLIAAVGLTTARYASR